MAQWIYRIAPTQADTSDGMTDQEVAILAERDGYLQALKGAGILILAGVTNPSRGEWGAAIFTAPDEVTARAVMQTDPAVAAGIVEATLFPYAISSEDPSL